MSGLWTHFEHVPGNLGSQGPAKSKIFIILVLLSVSYKTVMLPELDSLPNTQSVIYISRVLYDKCGIHAEDMSRIYGVYMADMWKSFLGYMKDIRKTWNVHIGDLGRSFGGHARRCCGYMKVMRRTCGGLAKAMSRIYKIHAKDMQRPCQGYMKDIQWTCGRRPCWRYIKIIWCICRGYVKDTWCTHGGQAKVMLRIYKDI